MNSTLNQLRDELAIQNQRGVTFILAAAVYWASIGFAGMLLPSKTAFMWSLWGTGILFPLSILFARFMRVNIFFKNELSALGIWANVFQLFFFPVFFISAKSNIAYPPIFMGVLAGAHFVFYHWIYRSRTYLLLAFTVATSSYVLGFLFIADSYRILGLTNATWFILGAALLFREHRIQVSNS